MSGWRHPVETSSRKRLLLVRSRTSKRRWTREFRQRRQREIEREANREMHDEALAALLGVER